MKTIAELLRLQLVVPRSLSQWILQNFILAKSSDLQWAYRVVLEDLSISLFPNAPPEIYEDSVDLPFFDFFRFYAGLSINRYVGNLLH